MGNALVRVKDLQVQFDGQRKIQALSGVNFEVGAGEVLTLLGESGSGKSVTLRTLLRLHPEKTTRIKGEIIIDGQNVLSLNDKALNQYRGHTTSMIFQEPGLAFDPVYTIGQQMTEALLTHEQLHTSTAQARALDMLERVQIPQARKRFDAYPHELSGGMRQRAMIALALICKPKLLLADEPTTALDASVQIQILLLLRELQKETGMSVIFVTHDIGAAVEVSDRIAVMYAGRIVEIGGVEDMVSNSRHPYTQGLLASTVRYENRGSPLVTITGSPPDLAHLPKGCNFAPRCTRAQANCLTEQPNWSTSDSTEFQCWYPIKTS
jgi:peptide/nickel transport system ATP-binding protein